MAAYDYATFTLLIQYPGLVGNLTLVFAETWELEQLLPRAQQQELEEIQKNMLVWLCYVKVRTYVCICSPWGDPNPVEMPYSISWNTLNAMKEIHNIQLSTSSYSI